MPSRSWQIQEAKNKLSELIDQANDNAPQLITRRGKPVAYVVSADTWERQNRYSLKRTIRACPYPEVFDELDVERDPDPGREIDL